MRRVDRPALGAEATFRTCIRNVRNRDLRRRLMSVSGNIAVAAQDYEVRAENSELHLIPQSDNVGNVVTVGEMVVTYNDRMAKKGSPGRSAYDHIKLLPKHDQCPFCGHRDVSTLDHILPKTLFPAFAVSPDNLVGCCKDCNKSKLDDAPTSESDTILHPYFDDVTAQTWLSATVVQGQIAAVLFHVTEQVAWSDELNSRVKNQFKMLGLGHLYSQQAARLISGQRKNLVRIFDDGNGGADAVRTELEHHYQSWFADSQNAWQTATYRALSESDWFCEIGYRLE